VLFIIPLVVLLALGPDSKHLAWLRRRRKVLRAGLHAFYDAAIFLSFSIQVASIVVLARLNYGISADDMGDTATRLTWSVSLVTLLPLVYAAFMPQLLEEENQGDEDSGLSQGSAVAHVAVAPGIKAGTSPEVLPIENRLEIFEEEKQYYPKQGLHFKLFLVCWGLSIYPFMSKMAGMVVVRHSLCAIPNLT